MAIALGYIGWHLEVRVGHPPLEHPRESIVDVGLKLGQVYNCSFAGGLVGIAAQDHTRKDVLLVAHDMARKDTRLLLRDKSLLLHSLAPGAAQIAYTTFVGRGQGAALFVQALEGGTPRRLTSVEVAQGCIPSWFPDERRLLVQTTDGWLQTVTPEQDRAERLEPGEAGVVNPDGRRILFLRAGRLFLRDERGHTEPLDPPRRLFRRTLTGPLSFSPDGGTISYGIVSGWVGKETRFFALPLDTRHAVPIRTRYLAGLVLTASQPA